MTLNELRKERHHVAAKISSWKKAGKDVTALLKKEEELKAQIKQAKAQVVEQKMAPVKVAPVKKEQKSIHKVVVNQPPKIWTKSQLESCEITLRRILDENDWHDGYQFRSSEWMSIKSINTKIAQNAVDLSYTIQYRTKNRRVEKQVTKHFNPDNVMSVHDYIDRVEMWVMLNSGDMDDKSIMFGARFNRVQFDAQHMAEQGWIIKK